MALLHISVSFACRYLNRKFPGRWIDRGGPVVWPPCSPDLSALDFYLWGHLKSSLCSSHVDEVETLRNRMVEGFQTIRNVPRIWDRLLLAMRR
jgi:hypothetical protein